MAEFETVTLTTAHAASSYGRPVLVLDGQAYGPADLTPAGVTAAELVTTWARRFAGTAATGGDPATLALLARLAALDAETRRDILAIVSNLLNMAETARAAGAEEATE